MDVNIEQNGETIKVSLRGNFTFAEAIEFTKVTSALDQSGITSGEFDLKNLESIDSSGLGLLVKVHDIADKRGDSVTLRGARGIVEKVLKVTKMGNLFEIS